MVTCMIDIDKVAEIVNSLKPLWDVLEPVRSLSAIAIVVSVIKYCYYQYHYVTVSLSCGEFKVRRKDFTWQKLTPIVSRVFFGGGNVPDKVRKEILNMTEVPAKDIIRRFPEDA